MTQRKNPIIRPYGDIQSRQRGDEKHQQTLAQGNHLFAIRDRANMSYFALARGAGIAPRDLLAIEAGVLELSPQLAKRLADVLGIRFSELWISGATKRKTI